MNMRERLLKSLIVFLSFNSTVYGDEKPTANTNAVSVTEQLQQRTPGDAFIQLFDPVQTTRVAALKTIVENWSDDDAVMLVEAVRLARSPRTKAAVLDALDQLTGKPFGSNLGEWYQWIWDNPYQPHPNYANFKKHLYARIDERFAEYFDDNYNADIRLDEVRWGGVKRDGIPPLKDPETIPAAEADYLSDTDVVFGVSFGNQARAYPKRILAWHEMVKDVVGGQSINGVYCTLCGSMIVYDTKWKGEHYELGTSGFLYRSNKLMYDHRTKSMWSTLQGKPVIGPLTGKGIKLKPLYVVTTTWGAWKQRHPQTDVLSLNTGHRRDYGEGVAYKKYFGTDELMFDVPSLDRRLKNKDEVLVIRVTETPQLAISARFLAKTPVYQPTIGNQTFVVLTDESGANRVYESQGVSFDRWTATDAVISTTGSKWKVTEDALVNVSETEPSVQRLPRASAHRAFWFAVYSTNSEIRLVR